MIEDFEERKKSINNFRRMTNMLNELFVNFNKFLMDTIQSIWKVFT